MGRRWNDKGGQNAEEKDEDTCSQYGICTWIFFLQTEGGKGANSTKSNLSQKSGVSMVGEMNVTARRVVFISTSDTEQLFMC